MSDSAPLHRVLLRGFFLFVVLAAVPAATRAEGSATAAVATDSLRGTTQPLERDSNALQWTGRALLAPPYWAWRVATWPIERGARLYETSEAVRAVADVVGRGVQWGPLRVRGFANYSSGEGFTEAGLKTTSSTWPGEGWSLLTKTGYIDNNRNILELRLATPERPPFCLHLRSLYESKANRRFHGLGPESPEEELYYDRRSYLFETWLDLFLGRGLVVDVSAWYDRSDLDDTSADEAAEGESFKQELPALFDQAEETEYTGVGLRITRDRRDAGAYSSRGTVVSFEAGWNESLYGGDSDYVHYGAQWQGFFSLPGPARRVLAFRVFARGIDARDRSRVPISELERAGGRFGLRGYPSDRFADLHQAVLTAEYRYRLTRRIQGSLFTDWGDVGSQWEDLLSDPIDPSFGFAFLVGEREPVSFHVAFGGEGVFFSFGSENVFSLRSRRLR